MYFSMKHKYDVACSELNFRHFWYLISFRIKNEGTLQGASVDETANKKLGKQVAVLGSFPLIVLF